VHTSLHVVNGTCSVTYDLSLQVTDAVSLTAVIAPCTRRQLPIELTFFWWLTFRYRRS
jgi:uncharacterized membrane protein YwaF